METTTLPVDLSKLTAEQRRNLIAEVKLQEKREKEAIKAERENYKTIVDETVTSVFPILVELSQRIQEVKQFVFGELDAVKQMKGELFGVKQNQQSDTFTTKDGKTSIKLGYRVTDNYDDTHHAGIEKVKTYLGTLAKDEESAALVETIMDLLKKDAKGNLKANRVLELRKMADRIGNDEFSDGITIIENSYIPSRSCNFIEVRFKDNDGFEHSLPLSISAFGLDDESEKE
jgi:hypothetical protein